jgi:hypothetical protein
VDEQDLCHRGQTIHQVWPWFGKGHRDTPRSASARHGGPLEEGQIVSSPQRLRRLVRHGTLPQLAAFEAVVRLGSVTRAAESLYLAQPTVSGHLRKLADVVGEPLLQLNDRRLRPTAAGLALLDAARDIFAALQRVDLALDRLEESAALAEEGSMLASTGSARPALGVTTPRPAGPPSMAQRLGERGGWGAAAAA